MDCDARPAPSIFARALNALRTQGTTYFIHRSSERLQDSIRRGLIQYRLRRLEYKVAKGHRLELQEWGEIPPSDLIGSFRHITPDPLFESLAWDLRQHVTLSIREVWNIYNWVKRTQNIDGALAEVGVFNGGSARLIAAVKGERPLYLFDTFEGLPETRPGLDGSLSAGQFCGDSLEVVRRFLSPYRNVHLFKGIFPDSVAQMHPAPEKYAFVHLDVDIYDATRAGLEYFYPRLSRGGVILTHDYRCADTPGVRLAFDEFFRNKGETVIELWDTQAIMIRSQ